MDCTTVSHVSEVDPAGSQMHGACICGYPDEIEVGSVIGKKPSSFNWLWIENCEQVVVNIGIRIWTPNVDYYFKSMGYYTSLKSV